MNRQGNTGLFPVSLVTVSHELVGFSLRLEGSSKQWPSHSGVPDTMILAGGGVFFEGKLGSGWAWSGVGDRKGHGVLSATYLWEVDVYWPPNTTSNTQWSVCHLNTPLRLNCRVHSPHCSSCCGLSQFTCGKKSLARMKNSSAGAEKSSQCVSISLCVWVAFFCKHHSSSILEGWREAPGEAVSAVGGEVKWLGSYMSPWRGQQFLRP